MSATVETRVEYDDRFRQRPELMKGAEAAMAYLDARFRACPWVPPPSLIRWGLRPLDPSAVELTMADADGLRATGVFPARYVTAAETYPRETMAVRVWCDLLDGRWQAIRAEINERIATFGAEAPADESFALEPQPVS